jgi:predicted RNase H-like nuclease
MGQREIVAAGIDGCRAGWVAAIARGDTTTELRRFADLDAVVRWRERDAGAAVVGVDVPMGLPERAGPRPCDRDARRELGPRWMCVFAPPDRELLGLDFAAAREVVRRRRRADPAGEHPVMTHQTINIAPRIAEADRVLRADPRRQEWLLEVHPELSFRALAGVALAGVALAGVALEPKRTSRGAARRLALVAGQFPDAPQHLAGRTWPRAEVARDDLLDAYAVLWTALRVARGPGHHRELGDGRRDAHGLRMRVVV